MPADKNRLSELLKSRNCDEQLISELVENAEIPSVNWDVATSRFDVVCPKGKKSYWRLDTLNKDGSLTTTLKLNTPGTTTIEFYPLDDVAGFASLQTVELNGLVRNFDEDYKFMAKTTGKFTFEVDPSDDILNVKCTWNYRKINEQLNNLQ